MRGERPVYHFTPLAGWMNDPNGLVRHQDEWHLFYQAVPPGAQGKHWGHAISPDLVSWAHLPIALAPDELGQIWSGSAVVDRDNTSGFFDGLEGGGLVAIFTHAGAAPQAQSLAWSRDRGRTWTKYAGNPVLTSGAQDFRDPKVFWHEPSNRWVMILAVGDRLSFFASCNLRAWTHLSEFAPASLPQSAVFECPDLFSLPGPDGREVWMVTASVLGAPFPHGLCESRYWTGHFDGERFAAGPGQPAGGALTDHGPDDYAAVTWNHAPGEERIAIGWMSRWSYAGLVPTTGWCGQMTIARRLLVDRFGKLRQRPVDSLRTCRGALQRWSDIRLTSGAVSLRTSTAVAFELLATIRPEGARECGLRLGRDPACGGVTIIGYDTITRRVFVDRTRSGQRDFQSTFAGRYDAEVQLVPAGALRLQIFIDVNSVEVFAQDGAVLLSALIFPPPGAREIEFFALGGGAWLESGEYYELGST